MNGGGGAGWTQGRGKATEHRAKSMQYTRKHGGGGVHKEKYTKL
jgi:hypothetical protein